MTADITELADGWPQTRFARDDDIDGLVHDEFTGLLNAGSTWLALVNGRIVSNDASVDDIDGRSGTAYEAPNTAYPLLYAMQEAGGNVEAQYFTNKTPIQEADDKLSGGDFAGYIELSEDVLSGDYYAVYYGDRAMYVGFLGDGEVVTGDEAFDRANDEVGLYEVVSVDLDVTEPDDSEPESEPEPVDEPVKTEPTSPDTSESTSTDDEASSDGIVDADADTDVRDSETASSSSVSTDDEVGSTADGEESETDSGAIPGPDIDDFDESDSVDSVDLPDELEDEIVEEEEDSDDTDESDVEAASESSVEASSDGTEPEAVAAGEIGEISDQLDRIADRVGANETGVQNLQNQIAQLAERLEAVETNTQQLEERLDEAGGNASVTEGPTVDAEPMEPEVAIEQTDLFARYASKAKPTLEDALDDPERRDDVDANLQFETHTRFDRETVAVDGEPFDDFLAGTLEWRMADWLVSQLPYEIQSTDNVEALAGLYEVLPEIDRIDLRGHVDVGEDGDGAPFDVVVRDQRGQPLIVADTDNSHDPVSESDVSTLVEKAGTVCTEHDTLGAALFVTESFFESGALDLADGETGGGFFSSRKGWVKLARKSGYHLCLVEGRREEFHVTLPDL